MDLPIFRHFFIKLEGGFASALENKMSAQFIWRLPVVFFQLPGAHLKAMIGRGNKLMKQLAYDIFSGSFGLIPAFVFFIFVLTVFFGLCDFVTYCNDKIRGLAITRPLRLRFFR